MSFSNLQRRAAAAAAALQVIAFATGGLLAAAMTNKVRADVHEVVAAHLNALFGTLWILALAYTLPMLRFGDRGKRRLVIATVIPAYANWAVTAVKSFLFVKGVEPTGDGANDAVFGVLTALVVIPSFVSAGAWTYGLLGPRPSSTTE